MNERAARTSEDAERLVPDDAAPATAPGVLTIDLDRIAGNWRQLARLAAGAECAAVVKADAYGTGAHRVIPTLARAGCKTFFVATWNEAEMAHVLAPSATVFMLDGVPPGAASEVAASGAVPVLSSLAEIRAWAALADGSQRRLPAALHVDTGLNRLGLSASEIQTLVADMHLLDRLDVRLVMSHLACADDPGSPRNAIQREVLDRLRPLLPSARISLAASDGLMLGSEYHYDLVRPGYALYGGQAFRGGPTPVSPAVSLDVKVLQVRDVAPGQAVGYSATWQPKRLSRIAVIAAGYADGLFRQLSRATPSDDGVAAATLAIRGKPAPIVGRVSMDLVTIDVTDIDGPPVEPGERVEVIGPNVTIEALGAAAGTIGYEVLTSLGRRFHRVYRGGE